MLGDKDQPFRCSKLAELVKCSMKVHLREALEINDEGGAAAQNGSLTHEGVAAFHIAHGTTEERKKAAWDAIASAQAKFPLSELNEVRLFITPYMNDPRNIHAKFYQYPLTENEKELWKTNGRTDTYSIERQVDFTLPPHPLDSTGKLIYVQGTYDQVRNEGEPVKNDLKTGKKTGWEMIHDYAVQMSAYVYGCRTTIPMFSNLIRSKIIRNHGYRTRENKGESPDGVFWAMPFNRFEQVEMILENIRLHVALWRNGEVQFGPGPHCTYCEFQGLPGCTLKWDEVQALSLRAASATDLFERPQ